MDEENTHPTTQSEAVAQQQACSASDAFAALAAVMPKTIAKWREEGIEKVMKRLKGDDEE